MFNREALAQAGIDVDEALERVMGNEMLFDRLLDMFLDDPNFAKLKDAIAEKDEDGAIAAVHSLKGTCGNLSMKPLFELTNSQLGLFRQGAWDEAVAMMPRIEESYEATAQAVRNRAL